MAEPNNGETTVPEPKVDEKENKPEESKEPVQEPKTIYDFTVKDIDGKEVSLSKYAKHPTIIVNVASNCGFTKKNYAQLNQLYDKYESKGLRIAAFPCNQFLNQESGCETDIKEFAKKNKVRFDMYGKLDVNGSTTHPLFKWLKAKQPGILGTTSVKWNFTKFLINSEGVPIKRYSPATNPIDIEPDLVALIEPPPTPATAAAPATTTATASET